MRVGRQVLVALVPGIVIPEDQPPIMIHVLEDVCQSFDVALDVDELPYVQQGAIAEVDVPANKPLVAASLVKGQL